MRTMFLLTLITTIFCTTRMVFTSRTDDVLPGRYTYIPPMPRVSITDAMAFGRYVLMMER